MLDSWLIDLKQNTNQDLKIFLIGNKSDLNDNRKVYTNEANNFMHKNQIFHFEETSVKNGINIEEIFKKAINVVYSGYLKYIEDNCDNDSNYNNNTSRKRITFKTNSIYDSVNSFGNESIKLRYDPNRIKDNDESDNTVSIMKNRFCIC